MPWPAMLEDPEDPATPGTVYVTPELIARKIEAHHRKGQAWKFRGRWRSYMPNRHRVYKTLEGISPSEKARGGSGASPVEDFSNIMGTVEASGMKSPPSSFGTIFLSQLDHKWPLATPRAPFVGNTFGGWEECFHRGSYLDTVWHYDIRRAYRWAACQPLPDLRSGFRTSKFGAHEWAVYLVDLEADSLPYHRRPGPRMITAEEVPGLRHPPREIIEAVAFSRTVSLVPTFDRVDRCFPFCSERISKRFWAIFNSWPRAEGEKLQQVSWRGGEERSRVLPQPFHNPIWASYISSRVKLRIAQWLPVALNVFVDAVWTREEIPTGSEYGDFRVVDQYPAMWFGGAGVAKVNGEYVMRAGHRS